MSHNTSLDQEFARAISAADFDKAGRLLKEGVDINRVIPTIEPDERGMYEGTTTYLVDVASRGLVETVRFLLQHGANPNISINSVNPGQTALLAAASGGHAKVVDLLLEHGADFSARDHPTKFTAMEYAISNENAAIVRSLLAAGAPATFRRLSFDRDGGTEAREIVRILIQHGFDINKRDDWGRTPLMWAADHAPLETIQLLIDSGADVNAVSGKNMNGASSDETALLLARRKKRGDVVDLLLGHGARETKPPGRLRKLMGW
jgi:ankyrin repeat domain-containing protein 17